MDETNGAAGSWADTDAVDSTERTTSAAPSVVPVAFTGVLPDLFREGQGIIATGRFEADLFVAEEVLAKHDENYMPKEVADALKESGHWQMGQEP